MRSASRYRTRAAMVVALTLAAPVAAATQEPPRATVLVGIGNALGWIGGQVEGYVARGRASAFAGLGFMPNLVSDEGDGMAAALGLRVFTPGARHRGLLELSVSALSNTVRSTFGEDTAVESRNYGPGIAVGYQFIGDEGLTLMLTGGVGLDSQDLDPEGSRLQPTLGIGIGYSVR